MNAIAFPDHNIDPRKKTDEWILQYTKAVWSNWNMAMPTGSIFCSKALRCAEIRSYGMGTQSIDKYKKELLAGEIQDGSFMKISWEPRTDGRVLRNIALAKLQKAMYNIIATPINAQAKDAQDDAYAKIKTKIMMREAMQQQAPNMQSQALKPEPGEPMDLEELEMQMQYSPKLIRAKDIEESVSLVFSENDATKEFDKVAEDIVDFGAGIIGEDLDENNKVKLHHVPYDSFGCSYTLQNDFSDCTWQFEKRPLRLSELSAYFDDKEMEDIRSKVAGRNGNPTTMGSNTTANNGYDIFKADVMKLYFISYNKRVTEENKDKNGNLRISKTKPSDGDKTTGQFISKTVEVLYTCEWVIGTDYIYNSGIAKNQKRSVEAKNMSRVKMPYHVFAASFDKMRSRGLTEDMISIIDDLNIATFKLRNFRNRMVPNGFDIDLSAIEDVALGGGGDKAMTPKDVIDMFFETGILVSRRSGISMDSNVNYKAINAISNNMADQIASLAGDIQMSKQALRDISGLNELTDGSTPNPKTLTTIANLANDSTNNALYYMINARKKIIENTAKGVIQRLQIAKQRGSYDGYSSDAGKWISVPDSIMDYDYDISIEDRPDDEQRQLIYQMMQSDIQNGFISHAEVVMVMYTSNLKHAAMLLAYKVDKGKEAQQNNSLQNTQVTAQTQMQSNQMAEQLKLQSATAMHQMELERIDLEKSWDLLIMKESKLQDNKSAEAKANSEILQIGLQHESNSQLQQQQAAQEQQGEPAGQ